MSNLNTSFETNLVDTQQHIEEEYVKASQAKENTQHQDSTKLQEISKQVINDQNAHRGPNVSANHKDSVGDLNNDKENQSRAANAHYQKTYVHQSANPYVGVTDIGHYMHQQRAQPVVDDHQQQIIQGLNLRHKRQIEYITSLQQSNQSLKLKCKSLEETVKDYKEKETLHEQAIVFQAQTNQMLYNRIQQEDKLSDIVQEIDSEQEQSKVQENTFEDTKDYPPLSIVKKNQDDLNLNSSSQQTSDYMQMQSVGKIEEISKAEKRQSRDHHHSKPHRTVTSNQTRPPTQHHEDRNYHSNGQHLHQRQHPEPQFPNSTYQSRKGQGVHHQDSYNSRGGHGFHNGMARGGHTNTVAHPRGGKFTQVSSRDQLYGSQQLSLNGYSNDLREQPEHHSNGRHFHQHNSQQRPQRGSYQQSRGGGLQPRDNYQQNGYRDYQPQTSTKWDDMVVNKRDHQYHNDYKPQYNGHHQDTYQNNQRSRGDRAQGHYFNNPRSSYQDQSQQNTHSQQPQSFSSRGGNQERYNRGSQGNYASMKTEQSDSQHYYNGNMRGGRGMSRGGAQQPSGRGDYAHGNRRGGATQQQGRNGHPYDRSSHGNTRGGGYNQGKTRGGLMNTPHFDEQYDREAEIKTGEVHFGKQSQNQSNDDFIVTENQQIVQKGSQKTSGNEEQQQKGDKKKSKKKNTRTKRKQAGSTSSQNHNGFDENNSVTSSSLQNSSVQVAQSDSDYSNVAFQETNSQLRDKELRSQTMNSIERKTFALEEEKLHGFKDDSQLSNTRKQLSDYNQQNTIYDHNECYEDQIYEDLIITKEPVDLKDMKSITQSCNKEQSQSEVQNSVSNSKLDFQNSFLDRPFQPKSDDSLVIATHDELVDALARKDLNDLGQALMKVREHKIQQLLDYSFFHAQHIELCNSQQ